MVSILERGENIVPTKTIVSTARDVEELANYVAELKENEALVTIERHLSEGISPSELLEACQKGMRMVGSMHEKGHYFIAGLIMAGEIMRQAVDLLKPAIIKGRRGSSSGRVLLGTIKGDIHDIGKNLFRDLLDCHGFTVLDLGVDVPPPEFVAAESMFKPHFIAASALITDSMPHLKALTQMFKDATRQRPERRPMILIGGSLVDERIFRMSGADYWAEDAFSGIRICRNLIGNSHNPE